MQEKLEKKSFRARVDKTVLIIFLILIILILFVFVLRATLPRQMDDVSPEIPCNKNFLEKSDVLYIIPKFDNKSIENRLWCDYILSLNKTLALHGIQHTYHEFSEDKSQEYLDDGIKIFQECFNKTPDRFKPPQLAISLNSKRLIEAKMKLDLNINQIVHKVYHCNDSGLFSNRIQDLF